MFEQWSERRRRWFLVTFCAVSWVLFANSLACLGDSIVTGGIGADAKHAVAIVGNIALWTAIWGAFKLRLRHWAFAALCGVTLSAAIVESGLRDGAAAAIWSVTCDAGNGQACHQLADYYASGRSPVHGWLDAAPLHARACAMGVRASCVTALNRPAPSSRQAPVLQTLTHRCLELGVSSDCRAAAKLYAARGELEAMYRVLERGCSDGDVHACGGLLDSGYPALRESACEVLVPACRISSSRGCSVTLRRCERVSSPHAGVD